MPVVTVTSFAAFANLVVAACKLASDPDPVARLNALADIATGAKSLDAALATTGLAAVATEMARTAEDHARHFTHPGRARDDAIALFWQIPVEIFADPATFADAHLDPALTTDRMVATIKASPLGRDFTAAPLPEAFFRAVAQSTLQVMLARADTVAALAPALWRQSLTATAAIKDDTTEILALVRELRAIKVTTVPEITLIAMARKISPRVADRDEALRALDAAADLAADAQARGEAGSNVDASVDTTLRRLATLTAAGQLDDAARAADEAVAQAEAGLSELLDAAIRQHQLTFNPKGVAGQIARRVRLGGLDTSDPFEALREERARWLGWTRFRGGYFEMEVAVELARIEESWAHDDDERGAALHDLGAALARLGEGLLGTARLEDAVAALRAASEAWTRDRVPLNWARTQHDLGNVLLELGRRERSSERLEGSIAAFRAALKEWTRERAPWSWANTQRNLGRALAALGKQESGTAQLEAAVKAFDAALEVYTRGREPCEWAATLGDQGVALRELAQRTEQPMMVGRALQNLSAAEVTMREDGHKDEADGYAEEIEATKGLAAKLTRR